MAVEQPLRRRGPGRSMRFAIIAVAFSAAAIFSAVVMLRRPAPDSAHRFDTIAFYGEQYTAGKAADTRSVNQNENYYDVYFPTSVPNRPNDLWRSGGVIHLYGSRTPQVVVLGSSHALMYSKLVDEICQKMGLSVAFLGVDATPIYFDTKVNSNFASQQEAREFDEAREHWLSIWHPDLIFLIDRWDEATSIEDFDRKLHSLLAKVCPDAGHVVFVSQVPVINDGDEYNLRELVTWQAGKKNALPALFPDGNGTLRKQEAFQAASEIAEFPNLSVVRADGPFYKEDGSVRYSSGRDFYYANADHLSQSGAEVLRGMFQSTIVAAMHGNPQAAGQ